MGGIDGLRRGAFGKLSGALGVLVLGSLLLGGRAEAEQAAPLVPVVVPLRSDDLLSMVGGPRVNALFAPLQLSLTGGLFPVGSVLPGCHDGGYAEIVRSRARRARRLTNARR